MPQPNAPTTSTPHLLDIPAYALPVHTVEVRVVASIGNSSHRVHARVDAVTPRDVELVGTVRCGVRVWRGCLLPAILAWCRAQNIRVTAREVQNARVSPVKHPLP